MQVLKHVETIQEFNRKDQNKFIDIYGAYPSRRDWQVYQQKEVEIIPKFDITEIMLILDIGLENYSQCAGWLSVEIVKSSKNANKPHQLFNLFINTIYGIQKPNEVIKYWKALTPANKNGLDIILTNYLVHEYNKQIDDLNYYIEEANKS